MEQADDETKSAQLLVHESLSGNSQAVSDFQSRFGPLVYGYARRSRGLDPDAAGDFYVYVFEQQRIFRRLRGFEGRIPFSTFLTSVVLEHMLIDWMRRQPTQARRPIREISVADADSFRTHPSSTALPVSESTPAADVFASLEPLKVLALKLLFIEDCELSASEIGHLSQASSCSASSVLSAVEDLRTIVRQREAVQTGIEDGLGAVYARIQFYERRLLRVCEDIRTAAIDSPTRERLCAERDQLQGRLHERQRQRAALLAKAQRRKTSAPYQEIANLLNISIGSVASLIARARHQLIERRHAQRSSKESLYAPS